ncbi:MAG: PAS domain-containing protein, partial [Chloroflexota bacterium]|nr:PAS domain-containing protein [Chloroflexota bacterium]
MDVDALVAAWDEASETIYLRGALDSAGAVIYTIDRSFRIMHVNAAWDEFALANNAAHLQTPAVIGTNLLDWLHGEAREQTRRICEEIFRGERRRHETDFDCSSPTERRVFTMVISPLRDAAGAIVGATFVSHDITRRKLLEAEVEARNTELRMLVEELRRQHAVAEQEREKAERLARLAAAHAAQFGATIAAMADGVWIANESGLIVTVNDAGLHMFGLRRDEVVGQPVEALPHLVAVCRGERRHLGLRLALGGASIREECDVQLPDAAGQVTVDISATPVRNEAGAVVGAVAVVRDITQAKAMARLKDDFLSVAAHELKTPITALKGFTQLALRRSRYVPELEGLRRALHTIDEQADRITNLVHELLDANRIHAGKLELR